MIRHDKRQEQVSWPVFQIDYLLQFQPPIASNQPADDLETIDGKPVCCRLLSHLKIKETNMIKTVLCIGDSNTYGLNPETNGRFPREKRWTGILQKLLGDDYYIIEEGYNGRTTAFNDASDETRSAITMIPFIMQTHSPVDLVIIMLGTNDTQTQYSVSPKVSAFALKNVVERIRRWCRGKGCSEPAFLLVSPIMIGDKIEDSMHWEKDYSSKLKVEELPKEYRKVATMLNCSFFEAASVAEPGSDCLHMSEESHNRFANAMAKIIPNILG